VANDTDDKAIGIMNSSRDVHLGGLSFPGFRELVVGLVACFLVANPTRAGAKTLGDMLVELSYKPVKMQLAENFWYVDVKLNGRTRRALVDTGSTCCVVDKGIAGKLPRVGETEIAGAQRIKRDVALIEKLEFGGAVFTNVAASVAELRDPWEGRVPTGTHIAQRSSCEAILGNDFLERSHSILHVGAHMLYLRVDAPTATQTNLLAKTLAVSGMTRVALCDIGSQCWAVRAKVNGNTTTMLLDTGAFATGIDSTSAKRWGITGKHTQIATYGTDNRKSTGMVSKVDLLEVCECRLVNYPVAVGDLSQWGIGAKSSSVYQIEGLVANDVLARANAVFDCGTGNLWVVPRTITK